MKFTSYRCARNLIRRGLIAALVVGYTVAPAAEDTNVTDTVHAFTLPDIDGTERALSEFSGRVLLIVNVASRCGMTPQYAGLQALYERYRERGLEVLGFPANNFLRQEPGSNAEIKEFCSTKYRVTFPMFEKISVKGKDIHPLYAWLTGSDTHPQFSGAITWNFNKFLIGRDGRVIARFGSRTPPDDPDVLRAIEAALDAPAPH